jgi:hypothetical protein
VASLVTKDHHDETQGFVMGPDGSATQKTIWGFRRIAPMFKDKKGGVRDNNYKNHQKNGQAHLMSVLARPSCYGNTLQKGGIPIFPNPSWEPIEFSADVDNMESVWHLAMRGVTVDEANDRHPYVHAWLYDLQAHETDVSCRIAINRVLDVSKSDPGGWPEHLDHYFDADLARWIPILSTADTTMVVPIPARRQTEVVGTLSLTSIGTSGQIPHTQVAVPSVTVVTNNTTILALNGNIEMADSLRADDPETRMGQDAAAGPSGPAGNIYIYFWLFVLDFMDYYM